MRKSAAIVITIMSLVTLSACARVQQASDTRPAPTQSTTSAVSVDAAMEPSSATSIPLTVVTTPKPVATQPPTQTSTPSPTPVPSPPAEYADATGGILLAYQNVRGTAAPLSNPAVQRLLDRAVPLRNTFHLATAEVGEYNMTYDGYLSWIEDYVESYLGSAGEGPVDMGALKHHILQQVVIAVEDPNSQIGETIRGLELAAESVRPGSGPLVYWEFLLDPLRTGGGYTPLAEAGMIRAFEQLVSEYKTHRIEFPTLQPDFGSFLAESTLMESISERLAGSQAPTPTPGPSNGNSTDRLSAGALLYDRPLSEWRSESSADGWSEATSRGLQIGVFGGNGEHLQEAWTERADFADIGASVEVREQSDGAAAGGCISVRHNVSAGDYSFCILGNGRTWATYNYVDGNGEWHVEELLTDFVRSGTNATSEWNKLTLAARGNRLWFWVNGTLVASVYHDARTVGDVALSVINWDTDQDAVFEFRNLKVWEAK